MKTRFLLSILLLVCSNAFASYQVVVSKGSYSDLSGATEISYMPSDSGYYFSTNMMFATFGKHYANFRLQTSNPVSAGGFMTNSGMLVVYDSVGKKDVIAYQCFEGFKFSVVPGITKASYKVEGASGSRILKCQWKDLVYNKTSTETANFQIWLHEADGSVSYHYGPNSLPAAKDVYDGGYTGIVVVKGDGSVLLQEINLEGKPSAPAIYRNVLTSGLPTLDTIPSTGTVYTFKYAPNGITTFKTVENLHVFPNPTTGILNLPGDIAVGTRIAIYDMTGKLAQSSILNGKQAVDVSSLPEGSYTIELSDGEHKSLGRFVKTQQ
jgi:hypothetical protein